MPKSKAKAEADARWRKKAYTRIPIVIRRDAEISADFIRSHAASQGESMNGFIMRAVKEAIERDNLKIKN